MSLGLLMLQVFVCLFKFLGCPTQKLGSEQHTIDSEIQFKIHKTFKSNYSNDSKDSCMPHPIGEGERGIAITEEEPDFMYPLLSSTIAALSQMSGRTFSPCMLLRVVASSAGCEYYLVECSIR